MKDFFVSYTGKDKNFATWVAKLLEDNEYSVIIQEWDFRAGDNLVSKINDSLKTCEKLIIILSNQYLQSKWCEAEWTAKLMEQMQSNERKIIPIRIEPVKLEGLLSPIIYIDIVDKTEDEAKIEILNGIKEKKDRISIYGYPSYYNVEHLQIDNDYYVAENEIIFQKTCRTKILTNGCNSIHQRISWFVDEDIKLEPLTEGIRIEILDLKDTNLNYNIVFDHLLNKNEEVTYSIKAILTNKNKHFENFFSTEIISPINQLNIHLKLEDSSIKHYYTQKLSNSPMNVRTEKPVKHDFFGQAHWYNDNPELHFEYKIYWEK